MAKYQVNSINEFKDRAIENNITLEDKRFFIGTDCHEPCCFGVYQDENSGEWVAYKNKSNGERIERYRGPEEALACQLLWDKLEDEIDMRLRKYGGSLGPDGSSPYGKTTSGEIVPRSTYTPTTRDGQRRSPAKLVIIVLIIYALLAGFSGKLLSFFRNNVHTTRYNDSTPYESTYDYNDDSYYDSDSYDSSYDGYNYNYNYDYYYNYDYDNSYDSYDSYDSWDWDSGSDWDSWDSWDSDWDSDW